jgi:hypothetical protein
LISLSVAHARVARLTSKTRQRDNAGATISHSRVAQTSLAGRPNRGTRTHHVLTFNSDHRSGPAKAS